jgi:hypothetical protein
MLSLTTKDWAKVSVTKLVGILSAGIASIAAAASIYGAGANIHELTVFGSFPEAKFSSNPNGEVAPTNELIAPMDVRLNLSFLNTGNQPLLINSLGMIERYENDADPNSCPDPANIPERDIETRWSEVKSGTLTESRLIVVKPKEVETIRASFPAKTFLGSIGGLCICYEVVATGETKTPVCGVAVSFKEKPANSGSYKGQFHSAGAVIYRKIGWNLPGLSFGW